MKWLISLDMQMKMKQILRVTWLQKIRLIPVFHYSVYFDLLLYANGELFARDSLAAKNNYRLLDTLVKKDMHTYRQFLFAHANKAEPYIRWLYGSYLKANNQPKGINTYNDVTAWLIAYQKSMEGFSGKIILKLRFLIVGLFHAPCFLIHCVLSAVAFVRCDL